MLHFPYHQVEEEEQLAKTWDQNMRILVHFDPQTFVGLVLPGARYVRQRPEKLKNWQLEVDALLDAVVDGEEIIISSENRLSINSSYKRVARRL